MKRILIVLLVLSMTGCTENPIIDCKGNENVAGICVDETPPSFDGILDVEIDLDSDFDPLDGVSATDDLEGDITTHIVVTENVDETRPGVYLVKYEVSDSFLNKTTKIRYVTVSNNVPFGMNMIYNGSFEDGLYGWSTFYYDEAYGQFNVVNDEMVISIDSIEEDIWYSPRLSYSNILLEQGSYYQVSFKAKADDARSIHVQVGELLSSHPWYVDFATDIDNVYLLTDEYQTFTFSFLMEAPSNDNGSILFEMGDVMGETILTDIYIDDVEFTQITEQEFIYSNTHTLPKLIEAEDYSSMQGIQVEEVTSNSGGANVGWISEGDYLTYDVFVEETGLFLIYVRVSSPQEDKSLTVLFDNRDGIFIEVPNTGGWHDYSTVYAGIIELEAGVHEVKIITDTGTFNIDYLNFEKVN